MIDKCPALIARCAGPEDVARSVGFARDLGLTRARSETSSVSTRTSSRARRSRHAGPNCGKERCPMGVFRLHDYCQTSDEFKRDDEQSAPQLSNRHRSDQRVGACCRSLPTIPASRQCRVSPSEPWGHGVAAVPPPRYSAGSIKHPVAAGRAELSSLDGISPT
jgi:hypothetical protein